MPALAAITRDVPTVRTRTTRTRKTVVVPTTVKRLSARTLARHNRHAWSHTGVGMTIVLSACLNGYANSLHASLPVAGAALGVVIPMLVFVLARVGGMQWRAGSRWLAAFTGLTGTFLLGLSVYHCATSLALLTGSSFWPSLGMAVAIDIGLVACELDIVLA